MTLEHAHDAGVGPGRDLGDLLGARRREGMEDELFLRVANVDAIEGEGVEVRVDAQGAVAALDHGQGTDEGVLDAREAQRALASAASG